MGSGAVLAGFIGHAAGTREMGTARQIPIAAIVHSGTERPNCHTAGPDNLTHYLELSRGAHAE